MRRKDDGSVRVGKKVVAIRAIGEIPEGSTGVVKVVDGLTWFRYWVKWDTGKWSAWVGDDDVVRVDRLESWRASQAAAAAAAEQVAVAAVPGPDSAGGEGEATADTGGVPAHLLARSSAARARRTAAG